MSDSSISQRLSSLATLNKAALCEIWLHVFNSAPNPKTRKAAMIRFLAYRIQEQAYGSLSPSNQRRLRQLEGSAVGDSNLKTSSARRIHPGTRLVREWQNQVHLVNVEAKGYEYRGVRYRSLSEIARLITGTRWSGPLFFGLKVKQDNQKEVQ
jgi:hypothetical protein